MITNIQLKAADTLFFRDAKPFSMGEETWANNLFPNVPPSAILGALRTAHAAEKHLDKLEIYEETKAVKIKNFGLMLRGQIALPIPLDLVGCDGETNGLDLIDNSFSSNPCTKLLLGNANKKVKELDNYRISLSDFNSYLEGEKKFTYDKVDKVDNDFLDLSEYTTSEPKIGIGRSKITNTTRNGMLYRVGMARLEGKVRGNFTSFFVSFKNMELPDTGILRLGAENRIVGYKLLTTNINAKDITVWENIDCFKIYLATPAILDNGILPNWISKEMTGEINGVNVKLQTCAVGRFLSLGGFDIKEQKPKQMFKAVPAGSVYYFELLEKNETEKQMAKIINHFKSNSFSELKSEEGLGVVYIAKQ